MGLYFSSSLATTSPMEVSPVQPTTVVQPSKPIGFSIFYVRIVWGSFLSESAPFYRPRYSV